MIPDFVFSLLFERWHYICYCRRDIIYGHDHDHSCGKHMYTWPRRTRPRSHSCGRSLSPVADISELQLLLTARCTDSYPVWRNLPCFGTHFAAWLCTACGAASKSVQLRCVYGRCVCSDWDASGIIRNFDKLHRPRASPDGDNGVLWIGYSFAATIR